MRRIPEIEEDHGEPNNKDLRRRRIAREVDILVTLALRNYQIAQFLDVCDCKSAYATLAGGLPPKMKPTRSHRDAADARKILAAEIPLTSTRPAPSRSSQIPPQTLRKEM